MTRTDEATLLWAANFYAEVDMMLRMIVDAFNFHPTVGTETRHCFDPEGETSPAEFFLHHEPICFVRASKVGHRMRNLHELCPSTCSIRNTSEFIVKFEDKVTIEQHLFFTADDVMLDVLAKRFNNPGADIAVFVNLDGVLGNTVTLTALGSMTTDGDVEVYVSRVS